MKTALRGIRLFLIFAVILLLGYAIVQGVLDHIEANKIRESNERVIQEHMTRAAEASREINEALLKQQRLNMKREDEVMTYYSPSRFDAQPLKRIRYFIVNREYADHINAGAKNWNRVGLGIVFEETYNKNDAQLFFRNSDYLLEGICDEWMTCLGAMMNDGNTAAQPGNILLTSNRSDTIDGVLTKTVTHEIGHYLGLKHDDSSLCSVMAQGFSCGENHCRIGGSERAKLDQLYPNSIPKRRYSKSFC